ncbi:MAG: type I glyceraldehyde-3-phosphate dehydrogenase [Arenicella sp.]|jgi:glyceraldehyde 3-phosphate dehydrogenase|nr:type I glyceraldehyde-3-phosphate dehydrogenase [Arenicella sp.]
MINIAINGFGRIGRNIVRAIYEYDLGDQFRVVAINDLAPLDTSVHLLKYDSTHGRFNADVRIKDDALHINDDVVAAFNEREPENLPWAKLKVDVVMECTGFFRTVEGANKHVAAGAKQVLISAPGKGDIKTIVYGVNELSINASDSIISNASCSTNCLAHIAYAIEQSVGIEYGLVNTVHAYTNTQRLLDTAHKDKRRGRAAATSLIPTSTGSAKAIGKVIPSLDGKLDAVAVRVPTINVSLLDLCFVPTQNIEVDELNSLFEKYKMGRESVFDLSFDPLVSIDYNHDPRSCVVDGLQTRKVGQMIKVLAWYDNEWGFSNRMLDTAQTMYTAKAKV